MKTTKIALSVLMCTTITVLVMPVTPAAAQSLFPVKQANEALRGSTSGGTFSLFSDLRAHEVGDVLTITINENTTASSSATTKVSQDEGVNLFGGSGLFHRLFGGLSLGATNSRTANGSGQTTRTGTLVTTLSVVVKDVLPNGILKVQGSRVIGVNKESQKVTFTGLVRPEDIGSDNTVPSNLVADVKVQYDGKGMVSRAQSPGILTRIVRFLF